ncbi:hypothetical protein V6N00_13490 [Tersicoccus sp. MR15.9]|uniref:hypothetical protein n=1 Tax=Tersicoccus mangrovi TaxID=3121635 RepID=UPI002FE69466
MPTRDVPLPAAAIAELDAAWAAYRTALRQSDRWTLDRLAPVVQAADAAGWSTRRIAADFDLTRKHVGILLGRPGGPDPALAGASEEALNRAWRRASARVANRRERATAHLATVLRAGKAAGWSYRSLSSTLGVTAERLRQIATDPIPSEATPVTCFHRESGDPSPEERFTQLSAEETATFRALADQARTNHTGPESAVARVVSERLSAMIHEARQRGVRWVELDEACGYAPGSARARAARHGYERLAPSRRAYAPVPSASS